MELDIFFKNLTILLKKIRNKKLPNEFVKIIFNVAVVCKDLVFVI